MKKLKLLLFSAAAIAAYVFLAAIAPPREAQAQVGAVSAFVNTRWFSLSNNATTNAITNLNLSGQTATNLSGTNIPSIKLNRGRGFAILPSILTTTQASSGNFVLYFDVSADGTNFTTTSPFTYTLPVFGTNLVVTGYTNFTVPALDNVQWLQLTKVSNASTTNMIITNLQFTFFP